MALGTRRLRPDTVLGAFDQQGVMDHDSDIQEQHDGDRGEQDNPHKELADHRSDDPDHDLHAERYDQRSEQAGHDGPSAAPRVVAVQPQSGRDERGGARVDKRDQQPGAGEANRPVDG